MPTYSGRIRANSFFSGPSEYDEGHPIRCAITGPGIFGHSRSSARICGSYASATDPPPRRLDPRRPAGAQPPPHGARAAPPEANAPRTVFAVVSDGWYGSHVDAAQRLITTVARTGCAVLWLDP